MINDYLSLSTRAGFNKSLTHFRLVTDIVKKMGQGENLADIIDEMEKQKSVEKAQIGPVLNAVVIDRMAYDSFSFNLTEDLQGFEKVAEETAKWDRLNLIVAYHHPQLGINLVNPKHMGQWDALREMTRDELVVLYAAAGDEGGKALTRDAMLTLYDLLLNKKVGDTKKFAGAKPKAAAQPQEQKEAEPSIPTSSPMEPKRAELPKGVRLPPGATGPSTTKAVPKAATPKGAAPKAPTSGGKVRMTPKYSVQVTNELFHNGNVEAWKNIVESYKSKYPSMEVHIFHDGQKVNNINSLFKWGKVKHGDVILFSVAGEEIKAVSKLQRYLFEGASQRFEDYMKKDVNKVLTLF